MIIFLYLCKIRFLKAASGVVYESIFNGSEKTMCKNGFAVV